MKVTKRGTGSAFEFGMLLSYAIALFGFIPVFICYLLKWDVSIIIDSSKKTQDSKFFIDEVNENTYSRTK